MTNLSSENSRAPLAGENGTNKAFKSGNGLPARLHRLTSGRVAPRPSAVLLGSVIVVSLALAACSGGDDGDEGTPSTGETPTAELAPQPDSPQGVEEQVTEAVSGVIETEMGDNFYVQNNLKTGLGVTVTIRANNTGQAIHNLRIAGADGQWNTEDDAVSDPETVLPGQVGAVEFTPMIAGTYTFRCDFHPLEQGGQVIVE